MRGPGNTIHVLMTSHRGIPWSNFSTFEPKGIESLQNAITNVLGMLEEEMGSFPNIWSNLRI